MWLMMHSVGAVQKRQLYNVASWQNSPEDSCNRKHGRHCCAQPCRGCERLPASGPCAALRIPLPACCWPPLQRQPPACPRWGAATSSAPAACAAPGCRARCGPQQSRMLLMLLRMAGSPVIDERGQHKDHFTRARGGGGRYTSDDLATMKHHEPCASQTFWGW